MDDTEKLPHGKNLRKGRVSLPNHAYLVTIVTKSRLPVFNSFSTARIAVRCFHDNGVEKHAQTLAFVVMPDHIHWLIQMTDGGNLPEMIRLYKAKVSVLLQQRIWQRGFHDHGVRQEDDLLALARYVVANPKRAGLVDSVAQSPHWHSAWL